MSSGSRFGVRAIASCGLLVAASSSSLGAPEAVTGPAIAPTERLILVGTPARISPPHAGAHFWYTLTSSPSSQRHLAVCALRSAAQGGAVSQAVLYGSEDGGESWRTLLTDSSSGIVSEVSCGLGSGNAAYFVASRRGLLIHEYTAARRREWQRMLFRRSPDFGKTWQEAIDGPHGDAAVVVVSPGATAGQDRILVFDDEKNVNVRVSADGGQTLRFVHLAEALKPADTTNLRFWLNAATNLPDGSVGAIYHEFPLNRETQPRQGQVRFIRVSLDGEPLGRSVVLGATSPEKTKLFSEQRWASIASGRIGPVPRVFVAWDDVVEKRVRIRLSWSDDNGATWSTPTVVDDTTEAFGVGRDTWASHPSLAVSPTGVLGLQWAEFDGRCWRFAASYDGGRTFVPSVALNSCATEPRSIIGVVGRYLTPYVMRPKRVEPYQQFWVGSWQNLSNRLSRGIGLVAMADSTFRAAWVTYGDGEDALYAAAISLNGDKEVARRKSVLTDARLQRDSTAWVDYTSLTYDESTHEFTVGLSVVRPSGDSPRWPSVLRVQRLSSSLGQITVVGSDNGETREGAAWLFDGPAVSLPEGSSAALDRASPTPEQFQYSESRRLRFRLSVPPTKPPLTSDWARHVNDDRHNGGSFLTVDYEVLGLDRQSSPK